LFAYSRPFETSMHGPLRHLWVADGPQRQLPQVRKLWRHDR
jgi:hypothetical protein